MNTLNDEGREQEKDAAKKTKPKMATSTMFKSVSGGVGVAIAWVMVVLAWD